MIGRASMIRNGFLALIPCLLCGGGFVHGQSLNNRFLVLDNGATVLYQIYSQLQLKDDKRMFGAAEKSGNTIRRTMQDEAGKPWLGFELHVDRISGPGPIRFNLSMTPLGGWNFFGQKPIPREIQNGDRVLLDVVEEPGTGRKIFDTFQVGIDIGMQLMPLTRTVPRTIDPDMQVYLRSPRAGALGVSNSSIGGTAFVLIAGAEGRFTFSTRPEPGFRMEAVAEGNRLSFVSGKDRYDVECTGPVVSGTVARYLWVKHEPPSKVPSSLPTLELSVK